MLLAFAMIDQGGLRSSWPVAFFSEGKWWKDDNAPFFLITIIFALLWIMYPVSRNHHLCFGRSPGIPFKSVHTNYASICQFTINPAACWERDDTCCGGCCRHVQRDSLAPKCFMVQNEGHTIAKIGGWQQPLQHLPAKVCLQPGTYSSFALCQSLLQKLCKPLHKDEWIWAQLEQVGEGAPGQGAVPAWHVEHPSFGDTHPGVLQGLLSSSLLEHCVCGTVKG